MRVYSFSEARQKLAEVLDLARSEDVAIRRRSGESFVISYNKSSRSPFDVPSIKLARGVTADQIVDAIGDERKRQS